MVHNTCSSLITPFLFLPSPVDEHNRSKPTFSIAGRPRGRMARTAGDVPLECGAGCAREAVATTSVNAVKLNAIFIVPIPPPSSSVGGIGVTQAMHDRFAAFVADLNADFGKLYSLDHWGGFETGAVTRYYDDAWRASGGIHLQQCENDDGVTNCVLRYDSDGVMETEQVPERVALPTYLHLNANACGRRGGGGRHW